jgi:hypothetical protein
VADVDVSWRLDEQHPSSTLHVLMTIRLLLLMLSATSAEVLMLALLLYVMTVQ